MNRVSLVGRITKDAEVKRAPNGNPFVGFVLAVSRTQKDANGQTQADFISCVAFGHTAEFMGAYIKKGYLLGVVGKIQVRNYQNQQGQTVYITEVVVDNVENLTPKDLSASQVQPTANQNNTGYQTTPNNNKQQQTVIKPNIQEGLVADDMLPF